ncbi:Hypothetical Protein FCC1311_031492 [Hondaea fermentalgiana]|uniref:Uncharacterized protein n=1 Tax=Hondaea fermentalgiana TaxID=2315210 RepID=A0A2R5G790_9STRA|nr:Hypothetical Protein FCC1311_031492 [Hondaea fermentalgiana]|eukprot:GBG26926.1 Hypothetical Protein FCC1311_031492 [Hondaea fermentalgiana]
MRGLGPVPVMLRSVSYSRELPAYCDCKSGLKRPALESHVHGVPKHSLSDLSAAQLAKIDRLTEGDKELYAATVDEFMLRLREVEAKTGKQILCPK